MADLLQIGLAAGVGFFVVALIGFIISRKVGQRFGFVVWALGYLIVLLRIVTSFVELPLVIVWALVVVFLAVALPLLFMNARRAALERREALAKQQRIAS